MLTVARALRLYHGVTMDEVGTEMGKSQSWISLLENMGTRAREDIQIKMADYYGVPVEAIFYKDGSPRPMDVPALLLGRGSDG